MNDLVNRIKLGDLCCETEEINELAVASFGYIENDIADIKKGYISLGFHLNEMLISHYYRDFGYVDFYECVQKNFGMDKSAVSRCISVWKEFAAYDDKVDSRKMWVDERYKNYSYSQLIEMLPLKKEQRRCIRPDMSVKEIREFKRNLKNPEAEKPVENDLAEESVATLQQEEQPVSQPEFPYMKNMKEREKFVNSYKSWDIWCRNELTEETFYRYDLPDGAAIVVKSYLYSFSFLKENYERVDYYLLKLGYKHFADCLSILSEITEYLEKL